MSSKHKLIKTLALAGAVTATGAIATTTNVHADTTASANAQTQTDPAQTQLNNLQSAQTASEQALASQNQATMQSATSSANTQLAQLNQQLASQQSAQSASDASALQAGTNQINSQAQAQTSAENTRYNSAVASQQASNSQALANAQAHIVTPTQKTAQANQAKTAYDTAQNQLNTTHQNNVKQLHDNYQANLTKIKGQIQTAQNNQTQAQKDAIARATQQVDAQITQANTQVQDLNAIVNNDQTAVNTAQNNVNSAQTQLTNAQAALKNAQNQTSPSINQSNNNYPDLGSDLEFGPDGSPIGITQTAADWKDTDPTDNATQVTYNSDGTISDHDMLIADIFAANVINTARKRVGSPLLEVSNYSLQLNDEANQRMFADPDNPELNTYLTNIHDDVQGIFGNEDTYDDAFTIADLKNEVYRAIQDWFSDVNNREGATDPQGHFKNLLGGKYDGESEWQGNKLLTLIITPSAVNDKLYNDTVGGSTLMYVAMTTNTDPAIPLDSSSADSSATPDFTALQSAVSKAKSALDSANSALHDAQAKLTSDTNSLNSAKTNLSQLQSARQTKINQLAGSAGTAAQAIAKLQDQANQLAQDYQKAYNQEDADYKAKSDALKTKYDNQIKNINAQPSDVNALRTQLQKKLDDLKAEHEANLKKINDSAQAKINALKQQLSDSHVKENQPIIDQINKIKSDLKAEQDALDAKLNALKTKDQEAYQALHDQLYPKTTQVVNGASDSYTTGGKTVVLPNGNSSANNIVNASFPTREEYRKTALPQTGNQDSLAVIALGAVSAMFGFGLAKKREY